MGSPCAIRVAMAPQGVAHMGLRGFALMSGTRTLTGDPLGAVGCSVAPPWIRIVCPVHPNGTRSDWDLGSFEGVSNACTLCLLGIMCSRLWCTGCSDAFLSWPTLNFLAI